MLNFCEASDIFLIVASHSWLELASCCSRLPAVVACWLPLLLIPTHKAQLHGLLSPHHHSWHEMDAESPLMRVAETPPVFSSLLFQVDDWVFIWAVKLRGEDPISRLSVELYRLFGLWMHWIYRRIRSFVLGHDSALSLLPHGYLVTLILRFWNESFCRPLCWARSETLWRMKHSDSFKNSCSNNMAVFLN